MNIWIINQYAIPPSQPGITRHYMLGRELARQGHDVTLIAASFDHVRRVETRLHQGEPWKVESIDPVRFLWLRTPRYEGNGAARIINMTAFAARLWWPYTTKALPRPDVILGSSPTLFAAYSALRLARRWRVPFVLEVRDLWPESLVELGGVSRRHPAVRMLARLESILYRHSDHILTLLPGAADYIMRHGATSHKITWLPNGVDLVQAPRPNRYNVAKKFTVMYAGTHGLANGLTSIIEAAKMLQQQDGRDIAFRFVGDGPQKPHLEQMVGDAGLRNVSFEAPVPKHRIFEVLTEADVFVATMRDLALYQHGISLNKLYDYMAAARPIIFGGHCMNPVADARCGVVVTPESAREIADAITRLKATSPEDRWQMGLRGRCFVEQHHSMKVLGERLDSILREAVCKPALINN